MRQTETASPTDVSSISSFLTCLLLNAEHDKELLLELYSRHTVDDKVSGGIHDNEKPWGGFQFPTVHFKLKFPKIIL